MNKKLLSFICAVMVVVMICCFVGCATNKPNENGEEKPSATPQEFIIQYSDGIGVKQIKVTQGQPYSLDFIPEKIGHVFTGLYDAEVGGTQFVNAQGVSLSPFTEGKSITLYPHFTAKEYNLILDYQGAPVTGSRQFTINYGANLPELPKNLELEHKIFKGWYTKQNCKGTQVADEYGLIPIVSVLSIDNFDLNNANNAVYLYAGFETEKFNVTCYFESGMDEEIVQVEWNTPVSKIVPKTRVNGNAPLTWSKSSNKTELFNGKVTADMVLYAVEYAPVIELDVNGGDEITPIVARANDTISLPIPTRENYKFSRWETLDGQVVDYTKMPSKSVHLKAVWQAMIVFDSNGGSAVKDISETSGTTITLPTPEKEGFIFAGWYDSNHEKYEKTTMPSASAKLKAGWYKVNISTRIIIDESTAKGGFYKTVPGVPTMDKSRDNLDLSDLFDNGVRNINIRAYYQSRARMGMSTNPQKTFMTWYSKEQASNAYKVWSYEDVHTDNLYHSYKQETSITLSSPILYICRYCSDTGISSGLNGDYGYCEYYWTNFWVEIEYPDMTNLYL